MALWCGALFIAGAFLLVLGFIMRLRVQKSIGNLMMFLGGFMLIVSVAGPVFGMCSLFW